MNLSNPFLELIDQATLKAQLGGRILSFIVQHQGKLEYRTIDFTQLCVTLYTTFEHETGLNSRLLFPGTAPLCPNSPLYGTLEFLQMFLVEGQNSL